MRCRKGKSCLPRSHAHMHTATPKKSNSTCTCNLFSHALSPRYPGRHAFSFPIPSLSPIHHSKHQQPKLLQPIHPTQRGLILEHSNPPHPPHPLPTPRKGQGAANCILIPPNHGEGRQEKTAAKAASSSRSSSTTIILLLDPHGHAPGARGLAGVLHRSPGLHLPPLGVEWRALLWPEQGPTGGAAKVRGLDGRASSLLLDPVCSFSLPYIHTAPRRRKGSRPPAGSN